MFCKNCGSQISDTAAFCTNCGSKVVKVEVSPIEHSGQDSMSQLSIPIVNIVLLIKWAISAQENPNKSNFAKAMLTFIIIAFILSFIFSKALMNLMTRNMYY